MDEKKLDSDWALIDAIVWLDRVWYICEQIILSKMAQSSHKFGCTAFMLR